MPRLVDFSIHGAATSESFHASSVRLGAFREAVRWGLAPLRIDAPFRKLVVDLDPDFVPVPPTYRRVMNAIGVAQVSLTHDPRTLATADSRTVRRTAAQLTSAALNEVQAELGWHDESFHRLVAAAGDHQGRYEVVRAQLAVKDRKTGLRYVPVMSWDETSTAVRIIALDQAEQVVAFREVKTSDRLEMAELFFDPSKAKLVGDVVEFRDRWDELVASVDIPHRGAVSATS